MPLLHRVRTVLTGVVEGGGVSTTYFDADEKVDYSGVVGLTQTFWDGLRSGIISGVGIQVQSLVDIIDETGALVGQGSGAAQPPLAGGAAGAALPPATQGLLRLRTGVIAGGRRLQGRLFIPGPPSGPEGGNNAPGAGYRTDINNAASGLRTGSLANGTSWMVWSRKNATVGIINGTDVWGKYAVLRSRRD